MRRVITLGFFLAAGALPGGRASAQSAGQWRAPQEIYAKVCHYCHDTHVGPVLFGRALPSAYVQATVRAGKHAMPSFRPSEISNAELAKLGDWIENSPAPAASAPAAK